MRLYILYVTMDTLQSDRSQSIDSFSLTAARTIVQPGNKITGLLL